MFNKKKPNIEIIRSLKKIFSVKGLVELLKAILKVSLLGLISYFVINKYLPDLTNQKSEKIFSTVYRL